MNLHFRLVSAVSSAALLGLGGWLMWMDQVPKTKKPAPESSNYATAKAEWRVTALPQSANKRGHRYISETGESQERATVDPQMNAVLGVGGFSRNYADIVRHYLEDGGNANLHDKNSFYLLHMLATFGDSSLMKIALDRGARVNVKTWNDMTPLHYVALTQNAKIIRQLLEAGANPNQPSIQLGEIYTPLFDATGSRSEDVWWKSGYYTVPGPAPSTAILESRILPDYVESVRLLVDAGADSNALCKEKRTPKDNVTALCDEINAYPHHLPAVQELETKLCGEALAIMNQSK